MAVELDVRHGEHMFAPFSDGSLISDEHKVVFSIR
jgi:hypothetical protein